MKLDQVEENDVKSKRRVIICLLAKTEATTERESD